MRSNYWWSLLFISLFIGCVVHEEDYAQKVVKVLREEKIDVSKFTHVAIIPEEGCGGCISEAEHFFQENVDSAIFFVFTKIRSSKELRLRLGALLNRGNVLLDVEQRCVAQKEDINIYPIIIDVRNDKKYTWLFLEPGISYKSILFELNNEKN